MGRFSHFWHGKNQLGNGKIANPMIKIGFGIIIIRSKGILQLWKAWNLPHSVIEILTVCAISHFCKSNDIEFLCFYQTRSGMVMQRCRFKNVTYLWCFIICCCVSNFLESFKNFCFLKISKYILIFWIQFSKKKNWHFLEFSKI